MYSSLFLLDYFRVLSLTTCTCEHMTRTEMILQASVTQQLFSNENPVKMIWSRLMPPLSQCQLHMCFGACELVSVGREALIVNTDLS